MGRRLRHPLRPPARGLCHAAAHAEAERIVLSRGRGEKPGGVGVVRGVRALEPLAVVRESRYFGRSTLTSLMILRYFSLSAFTNAASCSILRGTASAPCSPSLFL